MGVSGWGDAAQRLSEKASAAFAHYLRPKQLRENQPIELVQVQDEYFTSYKSQSVLTTFVVVGKGQPEFFFDDE
jgi:hypothetical protein